MTTLEKEIKEIRTDLTIVLSALTRMQRDITDTYHALWRVLERLHNIVYMATKE